MISDLLVQSIKEKSFVCVGLDPRMDKIPDSFKGKSLSETIFNFNKEIIDSTGDLVACFKPQIAFYEALGLEGLQAYSKTIAYARDKGSLVIGDVKRGDISSTAEAYARAHFSGDFEVDFITLNPYMGYDTLEPYLPYIKNKNKGIFVLIRTSNPGAAHIEYQEVGGQPLYKKIADDLFEIAQDYCGASGQSSFGFVFGGTQSENIEAVRKTYANIPFLIPGYGAQGAGALDIQAYLGQEKNSIVSSSRSIIYAFEKEGSHDVGLSARQAVEKMIKEIKEA